eukprot:TRINITY_DN496_c0_g1_i3.p1 TRINITY_DN496_c0_g1~~TRINITY_DN496_c0_g1_i3.p1  ORF type:complete len:339 (+),score=44.98 TRINITY_DN496_c0_g1_i3:548-1564(+)
MGKVRICLHHSSVPYQVVCEVPKAVPSALMTENDIHEAQKAWGNAIKAITKAHQDKQDFVGVAAKAAGELYAYGHGNVLFKPTKATRNPFRPTAGDAMSYFVGGTAEDAMSYFVGAEAMKDDKFKGEDAGFAINGGRGWSEVVFRNHMIDVRGTTAHAMGEYIFTDSMTGDDVTGRDLVQYTFGYKRCGDGQVRICLHHSSGREGAHLSAPLVGSFPSTDFPEGVGRRCSNRPADRERRARGAEGVGQRDQGYHEVSSAEAGLRRNGCKGCWGAVRVRARERAAAEAGLRRDGGAGGRGAVRLRPWGRAVQADEVQADEGNEEPVPPDGRGCDVVLNC